MNKGAVNYTLYLLAGFVIFNGIRHIAAVLLEMNALPTPLKVYASYTQAAKNGIVGHISASMLRIGAGLLISLVIAAVLGIAMGYNKTINKVFGPSLYLSYPIPKLALLPVIMIFFGIGDLSKIIMIVVIIVFQLIVSIRDAVVAIPNEYYDVMVSLKAGAFDKIRNITVPAVVPAILSSLRVSTGTAISVLIVAETYGTSKGLGFYVIDSWMRADYVQMYFGIVVLSLVGLAIFMLLDLAQKHLCRWKV